MTEWNDRRRLLVRGGRTALIGRQAERDNLGGLIAAVRSGQGRALVVRGEAGVGKTALLEHLVETASGFQTLRVVGVQSEMELAFAGLHQLCVSLLGGVDALPPPQRSALRTAFGLSEGPPPDRFLVGLAVLSLLSEAAGDRHLLCVVDDQHWLDEASAQALGFVARRLAADSVGLVFGTRMSGPELEGLPELPVVGLPDIEARQLLDATLPGPVDERVRNQIVAESRGNPLALLELPHSLTPEEMAGGFGLASASTVPERIEKSFGRQLRGLPADTRRLLQLAASDPLGDAPLTFRAAAYVGIPQQAAAAAVKAGLADFGVRIRFRHPLLRSTVYRSISADDRPVLHDALVRAMGSAADPERRAWHRAQAADGPDEEIAMELERSADHARARGGLAAAAAFWHKAVLLSENPVQRADRILSAAQTNLEAGAFKTALGLLANAEAGPLDEIRSARVDLLRGHISFASGMGPEAPRLLLNAARRLQPLDRDLARDTFLTAWMAAVFSAGRTVGTDLAEISRSAREMLEPTDPATTADQVLDALTLLVTDGPAVAAPSLRAVNDAFTGPGIGPAEELALGWFAQGAASALFDLRAWREMLVRQVQVAREAGALDRLPILLGSLGAVTAWQGDFATAAGLLVESDAVCQATGTQIAPFIAMMLAAQQGDPDEGLPLIEAVAEQCRAVGQGVAEAWANWNGAILNNGLGRHDRAFELATAAAQESPGMYPSLFTLSELVEAAVRIGAPEAAHAALTTLARSTQAGATDFGLGLEDRCRALLASGPDAEHLYLRALERMGRTETRTELARTHLLYGEWLSREGRRIDARTQLRVAQGLMSTLGMAAFAERARRELLALGDRARPRPKPAADVLTGQEALIARLAADGRTNPEIAAQLFISARTVEWHLHKVYMKLGINSRREVASAIAGQRT